MSHRTLRLATIAVALATTSSVADGFAPSNPSIGQPQHLQHQHQPLSTVSDGEQDIHYTTSTTRTTALHYKPPMMAYRDYGDHSDETSVALDSSTFSIPLSTTKNGKKIPLNNMPPHTRADPKPSTNLLEKVCCLHVSEQDLIFTLQLRQCAPG